MSVASAVGKKIPSSPTDLSTAAQGQPSATLDKKRHTTTPNARRRSAGENVCSSAAGGWNFEVGDQRQVIRSDERRTASEKMEAYEPEGAVMKNVIELEHREDAGV